MSRPKRSLAHRTQTSSPSRTPERSDPDSDASQVYPRKRQRIPEAPRIREDDNTGREDHDDEDGDEDDMLCEQQATQALAEKNLRRTGENTPAENGILESVQVINFMCHENFEYTLGPLINFICGKNGSGKSAILTALTLCLGAKASSTNRGGSLKDFIKQGKDQATIIVKIKNRGEAAYMPQEYGDTIIVERSFNRSGASSFKIKSERGRIVSTKKAELDEICEFYTLQMDNPMNVLSQDLARQFISGSSSAEKYKFFVKGVHLEQLDQDYRILEETVESIEEKLDIKAEDLKILEDRKQKARLKLEWLEKHNTLHEKVQNYRAQVAWAQVEAQEQRRDALETELGKVRANIAEAERHAESLDVTFQSKNTEHEKALSKTQEIESELSQLRDEKGEAKNIFDSAKNELHLDQAQQRQIRDAGKDADKRIEKLRQDIEKEKEHLSAVNGGSHTRLQEQLEEQQRQSEDARLQYEQHQQDHERLERNLRDAEEIAQIKQAPLPRHQDEIERRQANLKSLSSNKDQHDLAFSDKLPHLMKAIQNFRGFASPPIGPIGKHVRLLRPEWSSQLEKAFGGTLNSFIVTSKKDQSALLRLMRQVNCELPILIGNDHPIDVRAHEPDRKFDTVLRVLDIDNDLVLNQLVIQHGIEQTILIASLTDATAVMYGSERPRNVRRCYCINSHNKRKGHHLAYMRNGEPTQDPIQEWTGKPRMKTDLEVQIRLQQEALQEAKNVLTRLTEESRKALNDQEKAKQAIHRHQKRERELRQVQQKAEDLVSDARDALDSDNVEAGKLEGLKATLEEVLEEKRINDGSFEDSVTAVDQKKQIMKDEREKCNAIDRRIEVCQGRCKAAEEDAHRKATQRQVALSEKNAEFQRIDDAKRDVEKLEQKWTRESERVVEWSGLASQISPRVDVDHRETVDTLQAKLAQLERDVKRLDQQMGSSREQIITEAARTRDAYQVANSQLDELTEIARTLKNSLTERRSRWFKFRANISARAKIQFEHLLSERSFRGKVVTDHKKQLLNVQVEPDITRRHSGGGREARTLSGGEKSFSQICLLLAIWEAMGSPIRCLDEFDVFMDSVNRKASIDLLMDAARQSVGRQFILITPGSKSDIKKHPDVSVRE
ncbi:MAG: hypothetical protein Q9227_001934 [Pyrenula ochraceoflavens]